MKWIEKRAEYQQRFDELSQENIQSLITELNSATSNYVSKAGLSQNPNNNPEYNRLISISDRIKRVKDKYDALNDDIINYLTVESKNADLAGTLAENGQLQTQINRLEKIQDEMKVDVDSAIARDELLRSRNTNLTRHDLFMFNRPVRRGLIPYLWAIAVLFIGVGLVIFRIFLPSITLDTDSNFLQYFIDFFTNKLVLGSLLIAALIVILFLSLKIAGVFGK